MGKEWLVSFRFGIKRSDHVIEQCFIGDTPHILEHHGLFREIRPVHYTIIIRTEISVHVIEITVAAIKEEGGKSLMFQQFAYGCEVIIIGPAHNCLAGYGRRAERECIEAADSTGAGSEHPLKFHTASRQFVDFRRESFGRTVSADKRCGKAFHRNQNDITRTFDKGDFIGG